MISLKRDITRRERDMGTNLEALKVSSKAPLSQVILATVTSKLKSAMFGKFREVYHQSEYLIQPYV